MMVEEEACDVGLALGLGVGGGGGWRRDGERKSPVQFHILFPTHHPNEEEEHEESARGDHGIKRSRSSPPEEEDDADVNDGANKKDGSGKKLRLTKEQSSLLEDSFRQRSTLNPVLKKELSDALNLRPRQVEVWFQNRRARTKLKKTEVDCELLKEYCQSLSDENRRLKEELRELRSTKQASPYYMRLTEAATVMMCPSCERIAAGDGAGKSGSGDSETTFDATASGMDTKSKLYGYCTTTVN